MARGFGAKNLIAETKMFSEPSMMKNAFFYQGYLETTDSWVLHLNE